VRVEVFDRHAEHVDESVPLCTHQSWDTIEWGDVVRLTAKMEMPGWLVTSRLVDAEAEVEIHLVSKKLMRVIINHADYLAAKRQAE
jgi:hypothetical protein